jgi:hypothetical protein
LQNINRRILMVFARMMPVDGAALVNNTLRHMYSTEKTSIHALDCSSWDLVTTACTNASDVPATTGASSMDEQTRP